MADPVGAGVRNRPRRRWPLSEKRRLAELAFQPGASVAEVARENGVNTNQLFGWRRAFERGEFAEHGCGALLPVTVSAARESLPLQETHSSGSIHVELTGGALITIERGADASLLRLVLESLRK